MTCKWYSACPLRWFEKEGKIDKSWGQKYCKTDTNWQKCKRYQLEEKGVYHPDNMMPDGTLDEEI